MIILHGDDNTLRWLCLGGTVRVKTIIANEFGSLCDILSDNRPYINKFYTQHIEKSLNMYS